MTIAVWHRGAVVVVVVVVAVRLQTMLSRLWC